jgi:hypothetical protein
MSPHKAPDRVQDVRFKFAPSDTSYGFASAVIDGRERKFLVRRHGWQVVLPDVESVCGSDVQREAKNAIYRAVLREWSRMLWRLRSRPLRDRPRQERSIALRLLRADLRWR